MYLHEHRIYRCLLYTSTFLNFPQRKPPTPAAIIIQIGENPNSQISSAETTGIHRLWPVSYTHLDVYKRQGLGIEAGYAYFLSRPVTIEPAVYYKWRFDDSDNSRFGIKVGFGFYF